MWLDNASEIDILFYSPYAATVANTICDKNNTPLTVGLFGKWGAGKSTLINLIKQELNKKDDKCIVVSINAWLFEGYTDAKTSLMEIITTELEKEESLKDKISEKCKKLWSRINKIKLAKSLLTIGGSVLAASCLPPGTTNSAAIAQVLLGSSDAIEGDELNGDTTKSILEFREDFADLVNSLNGRVIVFVIDDLDRCTPERIIDTLEAIKLFLSVPGTTFLVAADNEVIEYAITKKYPGLMEDNNTYAREYIEKIIQLPITIPSLSEKDVMNYLMLLVVQQYVKNEPFQDFLNHVKEQKLHTSETHISYEEICRLLDKLSEQPYRSLEISDKQVKNDLKVIDGIRGTIAHSLNGNPRQAKRFLNAFMMKRQLAELYYPNEIDVVVLAKVMALYQISPSAFKDLYQWNCQFNGIIPHLRETLDNKNEETIPESWKGEAIQKWNHCPPIDIESYPLDHYFYLTREHLQSDNTKSILTVEAKTVLAALKKASGGTVDKVFEELNKLGESQSSIVISLFITGMTGIPSDWLVAIRLISEYEQRIPSLMDKIATLNFGMEALPFFSRLQTASPQQYSDFYKHANDNQRKVLDSTKGKGKR